MLRSLTEDFFALLGGRSYVVRRYSDLLCRSQYGVVVVLAAEANGVARPRGVEPLTPRSVVWCSIQLSYGRSATPPADRCPGRRERQQLPQPGAARQGRV